MARDMPNNRIKGRIAAKDAIQNELNQAVNRVNSDERILGRAAARSMIRGAAKMEEAADHAERIAQRYRVNLDFTRQKNALKSGIEAVTRKFGAKAAREEVKKLGKMMYKNAGSPAGISLDDVKETESEGMKSGRPIGPETKFINEGSARKAGTYTATQTGAKQIAASRKKK